MRGDAKLSELENLNIGELCVHYKVCRIKPCGAHCGEYLPKDYYVTDRPHGEWIPCSERLPDKSGRYIVTEKRFATDDRKHNGRYQTMVEEIDFSNNKWVRANFFEIIAWMPLPEPYKKEGKSK